MNLFRNLLSSRYGGLFIFYLVFISISFVIRTVLLGVSISGVDLSLMGLVWIYGVGLFFDTIAFTYFAIPFVLFLVFFSNKFFSSKAHRIFAYIVYFLIFYILLFDGVSEYFFWDEIGVRFNFIAVDYLVYTTEVIKNIRESYPLPILLGSIFIIDALLLFYIVKKKWLDASFKSSTPLKKRMLVGVALLILPLLSYTFVNYSLAEKTSNRNNSELSKNGIYSLFAAFINNELDYESFYINHSNEKVFTQLRPNLKSENSEFLSNEIFNISRRISNKGDEKKYNLVLITVESLSAEFMFFGGSKRGDVTPNLDSIANEGLLFTNLYATGTRTIWGLEAIMLSAPPKPGQSVIKRPRCENMFSLGQLFKLRQYDLKFIYGGYGYFDNMNYFFKNNGFSIVDRKDFDKSEITFSNAWGVCDQDLFNKVLKENDKSFESGKPFFDVVLTTSNHRPFTYPNGVIDISSPGGRAGSVKYCDYSIGEFIRMSKTKPWFNNTIFVIVADHCAGSAGQTELPIIDYQIPCIVFNPNIVKAQQIDKMASQIDIGPTILGLMNWSYESKFYGKDIQKMDSTEERAFVANYQRLGFVKNNKVIVLSPLQVADQYVFDRHTGVMTMQDVDSSSLDEVVMYYQSANYLQRKQLNKWDNGQ